MPFTFFKIPVFAFLLFASATCAQQVHYSTEAEVGHQPCLDTIKLFGLKTIQDMDRLMPTWVPIRGFDTSVVLEGMVMHGNDKYGIYNGPSVTYEDMPIFHYTHDMCFNITPDSSYKHLLAYQVFTGKETHIVEGIDKERETGDTAHQSDVHVEWESGLGAGNEGNMCAQLNKLGQSCGFASAGHERKDIIWNWPTTGDWVHVEGLWIWDRGHPPAEAEIHPLRFMAIRRALAAKIATPTGERFATRIDLFASGDGSPYVNNRRGQPAYVHLANMGARNYTFTVKNSLQKPSASAQLKYMLVSQKGNGYEGRVDVVTNPDGTCNVTVYWKEDHQSTAAVLAKTLYLYWDEGDGALPGSVITINVNVSRLKIKRRREFLNRSEFRVFMEVGGNWMFLNDLYGKDDDMINKGLGKTCKRNFKINKKFTLYVPTNADFRVYVTGWEADGMETVLGHIVNDNSPCNAETKQLMVNSPTMNIKKVAMHGCLDDNFGEGAAWHTAPATAGISKQQLKPTPGRNIDVCPCSKYKLEKGYKLYYTIERVN